MITASRLLPRWPKRENSREDCGEMLNILGIFPQRYKDYTDSSASISLGLPLNRVRSPLDQKGVRHMEQVAGDCRLPTTRYFTASPVRSRDKLEPD